MKRSWLVVALALILGAAFCVQATSTWRFGQSQRLADLALPALVILLEVGSITASAIFFSARSRGLRVRALLMLTLTAGLGGTAGVIAYGPAVGITVAILMVGLVEMVGAYRHETTAETTPVQQDDQDDSTPEADWSGPETVELPRMPDTRPVEVQPEPEPEPVRPQLESVGWTVDQIVADLRERGEVDVDRRGFQRFIRDNYNVGPSKATRVIADLRPSEVAS